MNISIKSGFVTTLTGIAAAGLLVAGCAMGSQSKMNDSSMQGAPMSSQPMGTNRFGGPVYADKPALAVTVTLVEAGGGPGNFSLVTALNHMLGKKTVNEEAAKLSKQYGTKRVNAWFKVMNFYVADTLKIVKAKGIALPPPAKLSGIELARTLVKVGTDKDCVFWVGLMFDHAVSHPSHMQLMDDPDAKYGTQWDANAQAITNQAFYDVSHALGDKDARLPPYHS